MVFVRLRIRRIRIFVDIIRFLRRRFDAPAITNIRQLFVFALIFLRKIKPSYFYLYKYESSFIDSFSLQCSLNTILRVRILFLTALINRANGSVENFLYGSGKNSLHCYSYLTRIRIRNEYSRIWTSWLNLFVFVFGEYEHGFTYSFSYSTNNTSKTRICIRRIFARIRIRIYSTNKLPSLVFISLLGRTKDMRPEHQYAISSIVTMDYSSNRPEYTFLLPFTMLPRTMLPVTKLPCYHVTSYRLLATWPWSVFIYSLYSKLAAYCLPTSCFVSHVTVNPTSHVSTHVSTSLSTPRATYPQLT